MTAIKKFFLLLFSWMQPAHETPPARKKPKDEDGKQLAGEFYFKSGILDRLESYFSVIRRMKKGDREAYNLYRRFGGMVYPGLVFRDSLEKAELSPWFRKTRPAFGSIFLSATEKEKKEQAEDEILFPEALYFVKISKEKHPASVEPVCGGDIYYCTVYWDRDTKVWNKNVGKKGVPQQFAIHVGDDGTVKALRSLQHDAQNVALRQRKRGDPRVVSIPRSRWRLPVEAKDYLTMKELAFAQSLAQWFVFVANEWEYAVASMTKVKVKKGSLVAKFSVNIERTPYFFADRDVTINDKGSRKKIFHIVRTHRRVLADGRETYVRSHFRGERKFAWNGYHVEITVPGWHHMDLADFDVGMVEIEDQDDPKEFVDTGGLAHRLARIEDSEDGAWHRYKGH